MGKTISTSIRSYTTSGFTRGSAKNPLSITPTGLVKKASGGHGADTMAWTITTSGHGDRHRRAIG